MLSYRPHNISVNVISLLINQLGLNKFLKLIFLEYYIYMSIFFWNWFTVFDFIAYIRINYDLHCGVKLHIFSQENHSTKSYKNYPMNPFVAWTTKFQLSFQIYYFSCYKCIVYFYVLITCIRCICRRIAIIFAHAISAIFCTEMCIATYLMLHKKPCTLAQPLTFVTNLFLASLITGEDNKLILR